MKRLSVFLGSIALAAVLVTGIAGCGDSSSETLNPAILLLAGSSKQTPYIITGNTTDGFTAAKKGVTLKPENQPIQNVINAIQSHAEGEACDIQFGDGSELAIGTNYMDFDGGVTGDDWGKITLSGKITSSYATATQGTIYLQRGVSVTSKADIANTASSNGRAIYNDGSGTVTIFGGTVQTTGGYAICNNSIGKVSISGGTVSAAGSNAVRNENGGEVIISGGTVQATGSGITIRSDNGGTVTITGGTVQSSGYIIRNYNGSTVTISGGTLYSSAGTTAVDNSSGTVNISGGTISTISADVVGNSSGGVVTISNGTLQTASGNAVYNMAGSTVTISGGKVEATEAFGYAIYNEAGGTVTVYSSATITGNTSGSITYL